MSWSVVSLRITQNRSALQSLVGEDDDDDDPAAPARCAPPPEPPPTPTPKMPPPATLAPLGGPVDEEPFA